MEVGIIGYGKMGSAIFRWLAQKSLKVTVLLRTEEKARESREKFFKKLERRSKSGNISAVDVRRKREALRFTHRLEDLASCRIVIESVVESCHDKIRILKNLEEVVDKETVLATNTSSISIRELAGTLENRHRFCGLHFFHPLMLIDLVEIITWNGVTTTTLDYLQDFCRRIGKRAILTRDAPGSAINSVLAHYYLEALYILEEGCVPPSRVDELARRYFYIGPCESMDSIGIDFFLAVMRTRPDATGLFSNPGSNDASFYMPSLFEKLLSQGRFGKKAGKGIYLYEGERPFDDRPEFYRNPSWSTPRRRDGRSDDLASKRLLFSVFNGCLRCCKLSLSTREDLDYGVKEILQMKEGPFTMAANLGRTKIQEGFALLTRCAGERFAQDTASFF